MADFGGVIRVPIEIYIGSDNTEIFSVENYNGEFIDYSTGELKAYIKRHRSDREIVAEFQCRSLNNLIELTLPSEETKKIKPIAPAATLFYDVVHKQDGRTELICYGEIRIKEGVTA